MFIVFLNELYITFSNTKIQHKQNKKPSCRYDSRPYCLTAPLRSHIGQWSHDHLILHMSFPIVVLWNGLTESISSRFRDIVL